MEIAVGEAGRIVTTVQGGIVFHEHNRQIQEFLLRQFACGAANNALIGVAQTLARVNAHVTQSALAEFLANLVNFRIAARKRKRNGVALHGAHHVAAASVSRY